MTREENLKADFIEEALKQMTFSDKYNLQFDADRGDDYIYPMEDLNELFSSDDNIMLLNRAYFGYDYHDNEKFRGAFNPNADYFMFNGYANLVSLSEYDAAGFLDDLLTEHFHYEDWEELINAIGHYIDIDDLMEFFALQFYELWQDEEFLVWDILEELVRWLEFAGHELEAGELESFLQAEESYL